MTTRTPDLLDLLDLAGRPVEAPKGLRLGWRNTTPDLVSSNDFQWSWPGQWTEAPKDGRDLSKSWPNEPCPSDERGGICIAKTWTGAKSGGIPSSVGLVLAYRKVDVLGEDADKIRVKKAFTVAVVDVDRLIRSADLYSANLYSANLYSANLYSANLSSADLSSANLSSANLSSADLSSANLSSADLRSANLSSADLSSADLRSADLSSADLYSANLYSANLYSANLYSANLYSANLYSANLYSADLSSANLSSADLRSADLRSADLRSADLYSARGDRYTRLPAGWRVNESGLIVRDQ